MQIADIQHFKLLGFKRLNSDNFHKMYFYKRKEFVFRMTE